MKIIYISNSLIPSRQANSIHVMKMCQAIAGLGHKVTLYALRGSGILANECKDIFDYYNVEETFEIKRPFSLKNVKGRSLLSSILLLPYLRKETPDLIYTRNLFSSVISVALGYRTIYETHTAREEGGLIGEKLFDLVIKSNKLIRLIVISEALKKEILKKIKTDKIHVAHDGADLMKENENGMDDCSFMPSRKDRVKVGYIGHLYNGRGISIICELAENIQDADFHIIGGEERDIKLWRGKCTSENLSFHGFIPPKKIPRYMKCFDILLMPYQKKVSCPGISDTSQWMSPLKMFEYMSSGKAIVSSNQTVLKEILEHKRNAILVSSDNVSEWIHAIEELKKDKTLRDKIGKQAQIDLERNYTWEKRAENVLYGI